MKKNATNRRSRKINKSLTINLLGKIKRVTKEFAYLSKVIIIINFIRLNWFHSGQKKSYISLRNKFGLKNQYC